MKRCFFIEDKLNGELRAWHDNGKLMLHSFYEAGKMEGEYKIWHENGLIQLHCFYKDDEREGECKRWHKNGVLHEQLNYKAGKEEGELKIWRSSGQLSSHLHMKANKKARRMQSLRGGWQIGKAHPWKDGKDLGAYDCWDENEKLKARIASLEAANVALSSKNECLEAELKRQHSNCVWCGKESLKSIT